MNQSELVKLAPAENDSLVRSVGIGFNHSCPLGWGLAEGTEACVLETIVIVVLTVLIIAGNLTVIFVFHCAPLLHHYTTSYFIQTMAYADLLVGLSCLVPTLSLLHHPTDAQEPLTCQVFSYVISVLKSVSMSCLAGISVDRYLAITKPLSYNQLVTPCRLRICIALIWFYSGAVFLPSFFGWGKPGYHGDIFEWCAQAWPTSALFTGFIVCLLYAPAALVVCFTYFHIFRICQQHNREINERRARFPSQEMETGGGGGEAGGNSSSRGGHHAAGHHHGPDKRYAMVLFRITSVFYALWLPYIIYFLLESSHVLDSPALSFVTTWLAISNSFCNCVIYSLSNSVFRLGMRRLSQTICSFSRCADDGKEFGDPKPRKKRANSCSI
ncbi:G-protein coupled receptor 52 [Engraulis encrasicolus]|uniref:G-protein coupled receptor 52 n=1 Tax=Engraulis encrasicolus TaxID=184585 RepID=UPI002FD79BB6